MGWDGEIKLPVVVGKGERDGNSMRVLEYFLSFGGGWS